MPAARERDAGASGSASTDKTLEDYDGLYHEILNEPEREQVLADLCQWLAARVPQGSVTPSENRQPLK